MGRPTKYTSPAGSRSSSTQVSHEVSVAMSSSSSSSVSHVGCVWYPASLLHHQLLVQHHSLRPVSAVNPWLMSSSDVSLSPDSTVKEHDQSSSDSDSVTQHERDANSAINLCQKSTTASVHQIPMRMSQLSSGMSAAATVSCRQSLLTQPARHWLTSPVNSFDDNPVLNLSVKPLDTSHQKLSSHNTATTTATTTTMTTTTSLSYMDDDNDSSGGDLHVCHLLVLVVSQYSNYT